MITEREQFEAWIRSKYPIADFERGKDGGYIVADLESRWESWQAANALMRQYADRNPFMTIGHFAEHVAARAAPLKTLLQQAQESHEARAAPAHTHRWNIDPQDDGSLLICEGEHEKNEACTYVRWTRAAPAQPQQPDPALIESMCMRYRHDWGLLDDERLKELTRTTMWQLWEEVVGRGFYKAPAQRADPVLLAIQGYAPYPTKAPAQPATYDEKYGDGSGPEHVICPVCGFCQHCRDCEDEYFGPQPENCPNKTPAQPEESAVITGWVAPNGNFYRTRFDAVKNGEQVVTPGYIVEKKAPAQPAGERVLLARSTDNVLDMVWCEASPEEVDGIRLSKTEYAWATIERC